MDFTGRGSNKLGLHARLLDLFVNLLDLLVDLLDLPRMPRCTSTFTKRYAKTKHDGEPRSMIGDVTDTRSENNTNGGTRRVTQTSEVRV